MFKRDIFWKLLRLDFGKPTRLHNSFLLKYNNNIYLTSIINIALDN